MGEVSDPGTDHRLEPNAPFRRELEAALESEIWRLEARRAADAERLLSRAKAELRLSSLRDKLATKAREALRSQEKAEVWVRAKHPALGKSPLDCCVDEAGLARCFRLLDGVKRR